MELMLEPVIEGHPYPKLYGGYRCCVNGEWYDWPKTYSEDGRRRIIESNSTRVYSKETRKKMSRNTKMAMKEKNMSEYLSRKWQENKEQRKAKLRITMYDRYGIIPQKYDLRDDVIALGLNKEDYSELFKEDE